MVQALLPSRSPQTPSSPPTATTSTTFPATSTTLEISEINGLNNVKFEPLFIQPDLELYDFRIDIIRQTIEKQVNDSTTETKEIPYHKLGFNLGNGLFYDLNDNLSLRIDYLLNLDTKGDFKIEKSFTKKRWNKIYSSHDGVFRIEYTNKKKSYTRFEIKILNDSLSMYYKNKYRYSIKKDDSTLVYMNSKRIIDKVQKKEENYYYQKFKKRVDEYKYIDRDIILDNKYKINLNQSGDILEIRRIGKKNDYPRYKIIRNEEKIFIFNDKYFGKKIVMNKDRFTLYRNDKVIYEFKIIE